MARRSVHWRADVPDSIEKYIASRGKNTRNNLKRYAKRLEREHGDALAVRAFSTPEHMEELTAGLEAVAASGYQHGLGVGYTGDRLQCELMELAARQGWLRARILYIATKPAAFVFGYSYRGTFYLIATSFDPAYGHQHVGLYIQMRLMEALCDEHDVRLGLWGGRRRVQAAIGRSPRERG